MLVIAPHPDDETLGAGGLIARQRMRGMDVIVAAVTDGENCYPDSVGMGEIRCLEQEGALKRLGVERDNIVRLRLPDSAVSSNEEELVERLMPLVSSETHVVAPWPGLSSRPRGLRSRRDGSRAQSRRVPDILFLLDLASRNHPAYKGLIPKFPALRFPSAARKD